MAESHHISATATADRAPGRNRWRRAIRPSAASFEGWDQQGVAAARRDCERDPASLLAEFLEVRGDSVALVASLGSNDLARSGVHAVVGRLSVGDVAAEWVHHGRNHVRQMLANTQARVWAQMGNARRFSAPAD